MQWLQRMEAGPDLNGSLSAKWRCCRLTIRISLCRLHGAGDFYRVAYVALWRKLLERHEGLHVFGYTARADDAIADALRSLARDAGWSRFAMRFSNGPFPLRSTVTIESVRQKPVGAVVCPEQIGRTESCSTCALCWSSERPVAFLQH